MSYYKDQKFHTKSMEEKFQKINFQWHYSIKSSLRQVINHLSLLHISSCRQRVVDLKLLVTTNNF